jgi:hypothetical protein
MPKKLNINPEEKRQRRAAQCKKIAYRCGQGHMLVYGRPGQGFICEACVERLHCPGCGLIIAASPGRDGKLRCVDCAESGKESLLRVQPAKSTDEECYVVSSIPFRSVVRHELVEQPSNAITGEWCEDEYRLPGYDSKGQSIPIPPPSKYVRPSLRRSRNYPR